MQNLGRLGFSEEQADLLDVAANFCAQRSPVQRVRALMTDELGHDPGVWRETVDLGWLGVAIPEAYGGVGLSLAEVVPIAEQMGRRLLTVPFVSSTLAAQALLKGASEDQKQRILPLIVSGSPATLALAEAESDWDLEAIASTAMRLPDGGLTLSGVKRLTVDAHVAERIITSVMLDGSPALVIVDAADIPAAARRRETIIDETRRSFEIDLTGVPVAGANLMPQELARHALHHIHLAANLLTAAEMCGGAQAVIDTTLDYLKTRKQFGQLIGSYQALKHPIVDAYVRYEQARSHLYSAAHNFSDQGAGEIATRMAKAEADAAFSFASDRAIQFHGGFGFTYDCDAQLYRRRAIWSAAQHGDATYHKRRLAELLLPAP
ncbi:acyl-CoA dehydrogenase [bacterium]|nr:acyl-CoA dehydrogenase [bacterium]